MLKMIFAIIIVTLFLSCNFVRTCQNVGIRGLRFEPEKSSNTDEETERISASNFDHAVSRRFVVYLLDSGVRTTHSLFANVTIEPAVAFEEVDSITKKTESRDTDHIPGHGHGTFTASIVAGAAVYANISIVPLVVVNSTGFGEPNSILKAVQFAVEHHQKRNYADEAALIVMPLAERKVPRWLSYLSEWLGTFVHPRLGGPTEHAWKLADDAGMFVVAAAGNWETNNCARFMADFHSLFIVGARTNITRAKYSNFGPCISIFANGDAIGASGFDDNETTRFSGTSVSAPLVAQAVIRYWTMVERASKSRWTASEVCSRMIQDRTVVDNDYIADLACSNIQLEKQPACQSTVRKALIEE